MAGLAAVLGHEGGAERHRGRGGVGAAVWGDRMGLGIVPFDRLTVRLRDHLGRSSPVDNRFVHADTALTARTYLVPLTGKREAKTWPLLAEALALSNRDANRMTVLVMTGVTAMARNSAVAIERSGDWGFLARQVGPGWPRRTSRSSATRPRSSPTAWRTAR